jgi:DNA-binding NarL/FixJ family response regulator
MKSSPHPKMLESDIKYFAILSKGARYKSIALGSLTFGEAKFKQLNNLTELLDFSQKRKVGAELIIDLSFTPEINANFIKQLRELGWYNILFIASHSNEIKLGKIFAERSESVVFLQENIYNSPLAKQMSKREIAIMQLLADGFKVTAIARKLHFSTNTIKRNIESLLRRLGYARRVRLLADLFRQGVLK